MQLCPRGLGEKLSVAHGCDQYLISPCSINQIARYSTERDLVNQLKCIVKALHQGIQQGMTSRVENLLLESGLKDSRNSAANLND